MHYPQKTVDPRKGLRSSRWKALEGLPNDERKRQEAIFELISTEGAYVRDLQLIVGTFLAKLIPLLDEKAITVVFANIEDILLTNTTFLSSLEDRQRDCRLYIDRIGDLIERYISKMGVYMQYCVNHSNAIQALQSLRTHKPELASLLQVLRDEDPMTRNLDLSSYLLVPMQRITRYPLLIKQILHYTSPSQDRPQIERSLQTSESLLGAINEHIREQEGRKRLEGLANRLWIEGQGFLQLTEPTRHLGPRILLKEGPVFKNNRKNKKLRLFLCNDLVFLTDLGGNVLYRTPMPLQSLAPLADTLNARDSHSFQLFQPYPRGGRAIVLRASSARECQAWVEEIENTRRKCVDAGERETRRRERKRRATVEGR